MKKFSFSLHRVLDWRQSRLDAAEAHLKGLESQRLRVAESLYHLDEELAHASDQLLSADSAEGVHLKALSSYRSGVLARRQKLADKQAELQRKIEQQRARMVEVRRDHRLLEALRDKRLAEWKVEHDRFQERLSADSHRALKHRSDRQEESS